MDMNQIRSFLAVSQTLNFTAAAHRNGVPQSTVSRQIDSLEEQLGAALFYRTKREVKLTAEGQAFLPYARELLEAAQKGAAAVRQLHEGAEGRVSIATVGASGAFLTGCLRAFSAKYPDIVVDIRHVSGGDSLLEEGPDPYDFHFLYQDMLTGNTEFESLTAYRDRMGLVMPKGHPAADGVLDAQTLQREKFLVLSEEESPIVYMLLMELCRNRRVSPRVINRFDSVEALLLAVASGLGITMLPVALAMESMAGFLEARPLEEEEAEVAYALAWHRELLNPAARLFLDTAREQAANL